MSDIRCHRCAEPVYFVDGIVGPDRWHHVRTQSPVCAPRCQHCGAPADVKIGASSLDGGGMPCFVLHHWECGPCAQKQLRIEAVR